MLSINEYITEGKRLDKIKKHFKKHGKKYLAGAAALGAAGAAAALASNISKTKPTPTTPTSPTQVPGSNNIPIDDPKETQIPMKKKVIGLKKKPSKQVITQHDINNRISDYIDKHANDPWSDEDRLKYEKSQSKFKIGSEKKLHNIRIKNLEDKIAAKKDKQSREPGGMFYWKPEKKQK